MNLRDPRFIPDPTTPFEAIVSRALTDMARIEDRVDAVFRVDGPIADETPPTIIVDGPELFREAEHGEALDDHVLRDRLGDLVNSLWLLHRRGREFSPAASQNMTLALFSTHQLVLNDWDRLDQAGGTDDSEDASGVDEGQTFVSDGGHPDDDEDVNGGASSRRSPASSRTSSRTCRQELSLSSRRHPPSIRGASGGKSAGRSRDSPKKVSNCR